MTANKAQSDTAQAKSSTASPAARAQMMRPALTVACAGLLLAACAGDATSQTATGQAGFADRPGLAASSAGTGALPPSPPRVTFRAQPAGTSPFENVTGGPGRGQVAQMDSATRVANFGSTGTLVGMKVEELRNDYLRLDQSTRQRSGDLQLLRSQVENQAAEYYALVAAISARLQAGTTPGNPRMVAQWSEAQERLDALSVDVAGLNNLASAIASDASLAAFLLESVRATYAISGAVEEDHENLSALEDEVNRIVVQIDRMLNDLSDDINRQTSYLASERRNLQTLSLAITNGELYGRSLANTALLSSAPPSLGPSRNNAGSAGANMPATAGPMATPTAPPPMTSGGGNTGAPTGLSPSAGMPVPPPPLASPVAGAMQTPPDAVARPGGAPSDRRPLVVIRFDRANVDYEQAVYQAVSSVLDRYPQARFQLMAISPARGNPAQLALASNEARRNAEDVLRTLIQLGLPPERISLGASTSDVARSSEVHLFVQ